MTYSNSIIPLVTAPMSVISSTLIIIMVMRSREKLLHIYHRLMFGLSVADVILSSAMSFSSLPAPKETPSIWKGLGSQSTCDAQGFFFMIGASAAPLYFLSLQLYYLCKIKYDLSLDDMKKIEPFLHGVPILFGLVSAIIPLATESMNAGTSWCWIQAYPTGCKSDPNMECTRGTHAALQRWVFVGGPMILILVLACIVMWMIYDSVRKLDQLNASHDFRYSAENKSSNKSKLKENMPPPSSTYSSIRTSVRSVFSSPAPNISGQYRRSRHARQRIFHYFIGYLLTISFPLINGFIRTAIGKPVNIFEILMNVFYPLQGVFNILVFILPNVKRIQQRHPEMCFPRVLITAITSYIGPNSTASRRSSHQTTLMRLSQNKIDMPEFRLDKSDFRSSREDSANIELSSRGDENVDIPVSIIDTETPHILNASDSV